MKHHTLLLSLILYLTFDSLCCASADSGSDASLSQSKFDVINQKSNLSIRQRLDFAKLSLWERKDYAAAADQYIFLLKSPPSKTAFETIISEVEPNVRLLCTLDSSSRAKFRCLRDTSSKSNIRLWLYLNYWLHEDRNTIRWFDDAIKDQAEVPALKENEEILQRSIVRSGSLRSVSRLHPDPLKSLSELYASQSQSAVADGTERYRRKRQTSFAIIIYGALLADNRLTEADLVEKEVLKRDSSDFTENSLAWYAKKFGHVQYHHLQPLLSNAFKDNNRNLKLFLVALIFACFTSISAADLLYRHVETSVLKLPNGTLRWLLFYASTIPGALCFGGAVTFFSAAIFENSAVFIVSAMFIPLVFQAVDRLVSAIRYFHASQLLKTKKYLECIAYTNRSITFFPREPHPYVSAAMAEWGLTKNYEKALSYLEKGLSLSPEAPMTLIQLSNLTIENRDVKRALEYSERLVQSCSKSLLYKTIRARSVRSAALRIAFKMEDAAEEVLKEAPSSSGQIQRALALAGLRRFDEAFAECDKASQQCTPSCLPSIQFSRAAVLIESGKYVEAKGLLSNDFPEEFVQYVRLLRCICCIGLGQFDDAASELENMNSMPKSNCVQAAKLTCTAHLHIVKNEYHEALDYCERANKLIPDDPSTLVASGIALMNLRQFDESLSAFDKAIAIYPQDASAFWYRHKLFLHLGETDKATEDRAVAERLKFKLLLPE